MSASTATSSGGACPRGSRSQNISYADLMKPDEDWRMLPDAAERRKIQNRLAQRAYRRNMRDRTKELEKLKKELAKLKEGGCIDDNSSTDQTRGSSSPKPSSLPLQQQQQPQMHMMANADDFVFDGGIAENMNSMMAPWGATEPFPQMTPFNDQPLHIDPSFFSTAATGSPSSTSSSSSSSKRRRTNSSSSSHHSISSSLPHQTRHGRSHSHTPLSSPPMVSAATFNHPTGLHTPPPRPTAPMAAGAAGPATDFHQPQLLTLSPCSFGLSAADVMDSMSTLPHLDPDSPPFTLDGFTTTTVTTGGPTATLDNGLWTPPLQNSMFSSFLSSPPATTTAATTAATDAATESSSSCSSSRRDSTSQQSSSSTSRTSPFSSPSSSSQFSSSPSLSSSTKTDVSAGTATTSCTSTAGAGSTATTEGNNSLLHLAVAGGHIQVLQLLLQRCEIPIDTRDAAGYTALQRAVFAGRMEMVAMLLEAGADFYAGRQDGGPTGGSDGTATTEGKNCLGVGA